MKVDLDEVKCITETTLTIRGSRRRTTVPLEITELLGLEKGDKLRWVAMNDGTIFITKAN